MKVKVCGLNNMENIHEVIASGADLIGLIFYKKSPRSVDKGDLDPTFIKELQISKVGVFVNESFENIMDISHQYGLEYVQLHGDEAPALCQSLKNEGLKVIKALPVRDSLEGLEVDKYLGSVDLLLFDTKGKNYGGNGQKFDWSVLDAYQLNVPYLLSGGITVDDGADIANLNYDQLFAADINSGFELKPGLKKSNEVKAFIKEVK